MTGRGTTIPAAQHKFDAAGTLTGQPARALVAAWQARALIGARRAAFKAWTLRLR